MKPDALLTDLYEFTMAGGYFAQGYNPQATFELFVRELPARWNYLIAAGLEPAVQFLKNWHFTQEEIDYLKTIPALEKLPDEFFGMLAALRFSGDCWAVPEGTFVFPNEPIVRITAPLIEAQLLETGLLAIIGYQTLAASKTSRVVTAAGGRPVIDFGSRRAHGPEASFWGARGAFIGGAVGTSNVLASKELNIPCYGTIAHSWVMAFPSEAEAFERYAQVFKENRVLLVDTYDVEAAVHCAARFENLQAIRIDSGDIARQAKQARQILDEAGRNQTQIMASGNLDEYKIAALLAKQAPLDSFGVGTAIITGGDCSGLNSAYKLVAIEEEGAALRLTHKTSQGKATYPGIKQIYRAQNAHGEYTYDTMALAGEARHHGLPLLKPVMRQGELLTPLPSIHTARQQMLEQKQRFPKLLFDIYQPFPFDVELSEELYESTAGR